MISNLVTKPTLSTTNKRYSSSPGAYKGFTINPGTSEEVAAQVRDIDSRAPQPTSTPNPISSTKSSQGVGNTQPSTIRGLIPDPKSTLSYERLVGGLADASRPSTQQIGLNQSLVSASKPTNTQTGLVKNLQNTAQGNFGIGRTAQDIGSLYAPEIARVGGLGAGAQAGYNSSGTNVVGAGNAAIASQSASQRMSALSAAEQAALAGNAQRLTAQEQAAGAFGTALGGANTQQAQQLSGLGTALGSANTQQAQAISGLGTAANLAQPQLGAIGQVPFNPLNQEQGAILGTTQPGGLNAAGQLIGSFQGAQAVGAAPGQTQATNYQNLGTASTAGQAAGIQALNAAPGTAQAGVIGTQTQQIAGYQSALQQGQNLQAQLTDLIRTFGLNPADVNAANQGLQKIANNISSPQYQILQNYVNDIANTYSQILTPAGGSATDTTRGIAASMLDRTAKGESLVAVMHALDAAAKAKIAGVSTNPASAPNAVGQRTGVVQTSAGPVNTDW